MNKNKRIRVWIIQDDQNPIDEGPNGNLNDLEYFSPPVSEDTSDDLLHLMAQGVLFDNAYCAEGLSWDWNLVDLA